MFNILIYSIVPSPYQRDLFYALARHSEVDLQVLYLEPSHPDNPWPEKPLQPYERVLTGGYLAWGTSRFHYNWHLPRLKNVDIVIFNGYQNLIAQQILHTRAQQIPCIFWGEKMVANSTGAKGQLQQVLAQGLNHCRAIVAIGSRAEQDYRQRFPDKPVFNIPYYCDLTRFNQNLPRRPRIPPTILCCGQMIPRKGIDLLLQAFARVIQSGLLANLLLVGREAELPQMMQPLPADVKDHIEFAGFQAPDNLPHFFQRADLFVLPSRYDGWGVVVNQALGAGLPIICSDAVGAAADLVTPGVNGTIVPAGDVEALVAALLRYVSDSEAIAAASQASLAKAADWTPEVGAKRWVEVFQKLTDWPSTPRKEL
ncbi:MAG: glycosyltransferase family 4 protein [Synechococcales cyanobacterium M58_A2018_015]|nr:glycosyltransferase family 4 protein [Synechococcales cyanobacterium M58_A2018_015]